MMRVVFVIWGLSLLASGWFETSSEDLNSFSRVDQSGSEGEKFACIKMQSFKRVCQNRQDGESVLGGQGPFKSYIIAGNMEDLILNEIEYIRLAKEVVTPRQIKLLMMLKSEFTWGNQILKQGILAVLANDQQSEIKSQEVLRGVNVEGLLDALIPQNQASDLKEKEIFLHVHLFQRALPTGVLSAASTFQIGLEAPMASALFKIMQGAGATEKQQVTFCSSYAQWLMTAYSSLEGVPGIEGGTLLHDFLNPGEKSRNLFQQISKHCPQGALGYVRYLAWAQSREGLWAVLPEVRATQGGTLAKIMWSTLIKEAIDVDKVLEYLQCDVEGGAAAKCQMLQTMCSYLAQAMIRQGQQAWCSPLSAAKAEEVIECMHRVNQKKSEEVYSFFLQCMRLVQGEDMSQEQLSGSLWSKLCSGNYALDFLNKMSEAQLGVFGAAWEYRVYLQGIMPPLRWWDMLFQKERLPSKKHVKEYLSRLIWEAINTSPPSVRSEKLFCLKGLIKLEGSDICEATVMTEIKLVCAHLIQEGKGERGMAYAFVCQGEGFVSAPHMRERLQSAKSWLKPEGFLQKRASLGLRVPTSLLCLWQQKQPEESWSVTDL